jgi:magnesium transporter
LSALIAAVAASTPSCTSADFTRNGVITATSVAGPGGTQQPGAGEPAELVSAPRAARCLSAAAHRPAGMRHCRVTDRPSPGSFRMLINCVAYLQGAKLAEIPVSGIAGHLAQPHCFVWVALKDPTDAELLEMQAQFGLHELAVEDARHGHQRPKIEEYGDTVFLVMHMVEYSPTDELLVGEVAVFVGPNFVLSVRSRSTQGFLGVRERAEREPHLLRHGAGFVFYALMDAVVDRYFPVIDQLEQDLEAIEDQIFEPGNSRQNIERLYALKRRVGVVHHAVLPLLDASGKLHGGRVPKVCEHSQDYFRDVYDHLARCSATLDRLRDTIGTAIQVNLSMVTIEESDTTKRLAAWAGIFAVATFFVGVWGMNFQHMPELQWPYGYPLALGVIAAVCGVMYWRFRKSGWL